MPEIKTTAVSLTGGVAAVADVTEQNTLTFGGSWANGDTFEVLFTEEQSGRQLRIGAGNVSGLTPTFARTFNTKVYAACGPTLAFSALGEPDKFDDIFVFAGEDGDEPGNGYITPYGYYGTPEDIVALANYQGRLAVFSRNSVQVWTMTADPAGNAQEQVLENLGTFAPLSVQPMGTLDVMFLSDTGIRSLRVRDSSNAAVTVDIGTPVDRNIQSHLEALTEAEKATACAAVEPSANRYWCFLPGASGAEGTLYVLSYFPSMNVAAWSTYRPTFMQANGTVVFTPKKFAVKDGRVYCRGADANGVQRLVLYGGVNNAEYENCGVSFETPWLDAKTPATRKKAQALDVACQGSWAVSLGMDPTSGTLTPTYTKSNTTDASSFDLGRIPVRMQGTHFKIKGVESGTGYARFSAAAFHFEPAQAS